MAKQLIFDCDGVLIDSEIIAAQVMVDLLNQHEIPISIAYYLQNCTGKTFSGLTKSLSIAFDTPLPTDFVQLVTAKMEETSREVLKPVEGIEDLLKAIAPIPKAVVSNSDLHQIKAGLTKANIIHHFGELTFSSQQVEKPKPSPQVYLFAANALRVSPENCMVVEDSVSGATAALAAGMKVIGFLGGSHIVDGHEDRLRKIGVRYFASDSAELMSLLNILMH